MTTTVVVSEFRATREVNHVSDEVVSSHSAHRMFKVYGVTDPSLALAQGGIPQFGEGFPSNGALTAVSQRASLDDAHDDQCTVDIGYVDLNADVGKLTYDASSDGEFDQFWRADPGLAVPDNGLVAADNTINIIGTHVDIAGHPVSRLRQKSVLLINIILKQDELQIAPVSPYIGRRNSTLFAGFSPGTLVYAGVRTSGRLGFKRVQFQHIFKGDSYFHLVQYPDRNASGIVILGPDKTAKNVYWRQPFPGLSDFHNISSYFAAL